MNSCRFCACEPARLLAGAVEIEFELAADSEVDAEVSCEAYAESEYRLGGSVVVFQRH